MRAPYFSKNTASNLQDPYSPKAPVACRRRSLRPRAPSAAPPSKTNPLRGVACDPHSTARIWHIWHERKERRDWGGGRLRRYRGLLRTLDGRKNAGERPPTKAMLRRRSSGSDGRRDQLASCSSCSRVKRARSSLVAQDYCRCPQDVTEAQHEALVVETPSPSREQPTFSTPSAAVTEDLGVSLHIFRELQLLQTREIGPEDYDLLMLLHAKSSRRVLDEATLHAVTEDVCGGDQGGAACPICLSQMSSGDRCCRLACQGRHVFHRDCLSEWLRTASCCCPVDQQDLSKTQC